MASGLGLEDKSLNPDTWTPRPVISLRGLRLTYMIQGRKNVSVCSEKGRKAHQGYEGENKEERYEPNSEIDIDDKVFPGMNKSPEEIAQEIRFAAVVK